MASSAADKNHLTVVFFPFPSPGHIFPLVDTAKIMAARFGIRAIVVTTTGNAPLVHLSDDMITLLTLPFTSSAPESTTAMRDHGQQPAFLAALYELELPFERLLKDHSIDPDCIVADAMVPWATDVSSRLGIPRLVFNVVGCFPSALLGLAGSVKPDADEPFLVPGIPHSVRMTRSQLPPVSADRSWDDHLAKLNDSWARSAGCVTNTFFEVEPEYVEIMKNLVPPHKLWSIGPVSQALPARDARSTRHRVLCWLDAKDPGSVVYVCFGTLGQLTAAQLREMAAGLESCGHPFVLVLPKCDAESDSLLPESGNGLVVREWVPQTAVLSHRAVGCFMTQCGWNSFLEGVSAGVPMVTWPLIIDQFFTERLVVDVLRVGVAVGCRVSSFWKEERPLVRAAEVRQAVDEVMGRGDEAEERRRRMRRLAAMASAAVEEGEGSSYRAMRDMIQELVRMKLARAPMHVSAN